MVYWGKHFVNWYSTNSYTCWNRLEWYLFPNYNNECIVMFFRIIYIIHRPRELLWVLLFLKYYIKLLVKLLWTVNVNFNSHACILFIAICRIMKAFIFHFISTSRRRKCLWLFQLSPLSQLLIFRQLLANGFRRTKRLLSSSLHYTTLYLTFVKPPSKRFVSMPKSPEILNQWLRHQELKVLWIPAWGLVSQKEAK